MDKLSDEYVRRLVEGEGCFTFDTQRRKTKSRGLETYKIPTFVIAMHERDEELLRKVRLTIGLSGTNSHGIYINNPSSKDGYNRGRIAKLIVRDYISLKEKVVPFFYKKLHGNKGAQFEDWLNKIGNKDVPYPFKNIHKLYKEDYFENDAQILF